MESRDSHTSSPSAVTGPRVAAIAAGAVVFLAALFRQEGIPKVDTLWAEDGAVFLQCAYDQVSLGCIPQPYQGYLHVVPRLVAVLAALVPPVAGSAAVTFLAGLVAAIAASVAAWSIAAATGSAVAGVLGAAGLGLVWEAGREVLGNTANLHWVLLAASLLAMATAMVGARITIGTIVLAAATGLSSALAPVLVAGSAVLLLLRRPHARVLFIVCAVAAAAQLITVLVAVRDSPPGVEVGLAELVRFGRTEVLREGFFGRVPTLVGLAVAGLPVVLSAGIALTSWSRAEKSRAIAAVLGLAALGIAICVVSMVANHSLNPRYAYMPAALLVAAIGLGAGLLARGFERDPRLAPAARFVPAVLAIVLGVGFAASFRLEARASTGPAVPPQVEAAAAACPGAGVVPIQISPRPASTEWILRLPCGRVGTQ